MKIGLTTFVLLLIVLMAANVGCLDDKKDGKEYFSETYDKIFLNFNIKSNEINNTSYVIIPAPVQNGKTLELAPFQNMTDFQNYSFEHVDTEHGKGVRISPIPQGQVWIWFSCEPYTAKGPFDIKQNVQCYKTGYPELSTWETDGTSGYYWFFSSVNVTALNFKFEYSDCYTKPHLFFVTFI